MSSNNPIRVFVAHAFDRHADYLRVFEYLESRDNFFYLNTSNPDRPPGADLEALKEELRNQIKAAEIMILPVSVYDAHRDLLTFEMDAAGAFKKPILAVKSFGETVVLQRSVMERADDIVEWNERSLVDAIRRLARHEDTARWETIEFKLD
jgi:hypothetical protein